MKTQQRNCNHDWQEKENKIVCTKCGSDRLKLVEGDEVGLKVGIRENGMKYTVRDTRNRYFFPDEWTTFYNKLKPTHKLLFETLLLTGARIEEALRIKVAHVRFDRKYLTLYTTKVKAAKKEWKPKPRDISLSSQYLKQLKRYISTHNKKDDDYLFISPEAGLSPEQMKKYCRKKSSVTYQLMRRTMRRANIKDYHQYSLHNIRKTCGMWLKALGVSMEEICLRLGHDADTYLKHYGSPDIFQRNDKLQMITILGDVYNLK